MTKLTVEYIDELLKTVTVQLTVGTEPTPYVQASAWLGTFYLGTSVSKAVDPKNFNVELGKEYATRNVLSTAKDKLWELEGYCLYKTL